MGCGAIGQCSEDFQVSCCRLGQVLGSHQERRANHPDTIVYAQDTSTLLQHAVDTAEGRKPEPLRSKMGVKLPRMPKRGEVDFIYGGEPLS